MAAFDAKLIAIRVPNKDINVEILKPIIMSSLNEGLNRIDLKIIGEITWQDFRDNNGSREINKYLRVRKKTIDDQKKEAKDSFHDINVGGGRRYDTFEHWGSTKYAQCSISRMDDYILVWFSFHSKLYHVMEEFRDLTFDVSRIISTRIEMEVMTFGVTSFTRQGDEFILFYKGKKRHQEGGKGALTKVRSTYNIDINNIMDNVEHNISIFYAPIDYARTLEERGEQKKRFETLTKQAEELVVSDKETSDNMVCTFTKENTSFMEWNDRQVKMFEHALKSEPIGTLVFFTIDESRIDVPPEVAKESEFY